MTRSLLIRVPLVVLGTSRALLNYLSGSVSFQPAGTEEWVVSATLDVS
jgi:hypothetical protein